MKCPHCKANVGLFDKSLNQWGKKKTCSHCNREVKVKITWKKFFMFGIPIFLVEAAITTLFSLGFYEYILGGLAVVIVIALSMELGKVEQK